MKKNIEFIITLVVLLVVAYFAVMNSNSVYKSPVNNRYNVGSIYVKETTLDYRKYSESVSPKAMCNISAEVSVGILKEVYKTFMAIGDDKVSGWKLLEKGSKQSGLAYKLWVNRYDKSVYTLTLSGTDQIRDTSQYFPMMMDEEYPIQMKETLEVGKKIVSLLEKNTSAGNGEKMTDFYITGHSLGGYLSAFLASEIVDSYNGENHQNIKYSDFLYSNFSIENVHCYTFGAPGFYNKPMDEGVLGIGIYANHPIPSWGVKKKTNNEQGKYDDVITNYYNNLDLVGTLYVANDNLKHLGTTIVMWVNNANPVNLYLLSVNFVEVPKKLYYHMPWVYINVLDKMG